ncbi:MAG: hypothetical protein AAGL98_12700, partial [Planctomycetota bacterium]
ARPSVGFVPQLGFLLPGSLSGGILGTSAGLNDFRASPGAVNPPTTPTGFVTPEPTSVAVWMIAASGMVGPRRKNRGHC